MNLLDRSSDLFACAPKACSGYQRVGGGSRSGHGREVAEAAASDGFDVEAGGADVFEVVVGELVEFETLLVGAVALEPVGPEAVEAGAGGGGGGGLGGGFGLGCGHGGGSLAILLRMAGGIAGFWVGRCAWGHVVGWFGVGWSVALRLHPILATSPGLGTVSAIRYRTLGVALPEPLS